LLQFTKKSIAMPDKFGMACLDLIFMGRVPLARANDDLGFGCLAAWSRRFLRGTVFPYLFNK
jgi:hypothetical protein